MRLAMDPTTVAGGWDTLGIEGDGVRVGGHSLCTVALLLAGCGSLTAVNELDGVPSDDTDNVTDAPPGDDDDDDDSGPCVDDDGDGVCNSDEACPGFDDALDNDGDGAPDGCDPCPIDAPDDTDGDGACDSDDVCPADPSDQCFHDINCSFTVDYWDYEATWFVGYPDGTVIESGGFNVPYEQIQRSYAISVGTELCIRTDDTLGDGGVAVLVVDGTTGATVAQWADDEYGLTRMDCFFVQ